MTTTLSLVEGLDRLALALTPNSVVRILTTTTPSAFPDHHVFFIKANQCTTSIGFCYPPGKARLAALKAQYPRIRFWTSYTRNQNFILLEHRKYVGAVLQPCQHYAYRFTGNLFVPKSSNTITSQSPEETIALRSLYSKLT